MTLKDMTKWNKGVSAIYALGVWTMIGSFAYLHYTGRFKDDTSQKEEERPEERNNPYEVVHQTAHTKTTIISKKDFVPYTTRIYHFFQSFTGGPGAGDS